MACGDLPESVRLPDGRTEPFEPERIARSLFAAGERTGKFRLGTDQLLTGADGKSSISFEDFAVALADEIERPAHIRQRFTVGY